MVDIINVKCEPDMAGLLTQTYGFLSGYHMNKKVLDYNVVGWKGERKQRYWIFLDLSYDFD